MSKVSEALALRAIEVMPGRQSNFRELKGADPLFLKSADGLTYTDVDGKQYLDFTLSMGAALWGYGDDEYKHAVAGQLDRLLAFSSAAAQSELEVHLAEAIVDRVPGAEWVRFGISGTEAISWRCALLAATRAVHCFCASRAIITVGWTMSPEGRRKRLWILRMLCCPTKAPSDPGPLPKRRR